MKTPEITQVKVDSSVTIDRSKQKSPTGFTASCNKLYDSLTNANRKARQDNNVVVTDQSKPKKYMPTHLTKNKALSQCILSEALSLLHKCEQRMLWLLITKHEPAGDLSLNTAKTMHIHLTRQKTFTTHAFRQ